LPAPCVPDLLGEQVSLSRRLPAGDYPTVGAFPEIITVEHIGVVSIWEVNLRITLFITFAPLRFGKKPAPQFLLGGSQADVDHVPPKHAPAVLGHCPPNRTHVLRCQRWKCI